MKKLLSLLILLFPFISIAQVDNAETVPDKRNCPTMEVLDRLISEDPGYQQRLESIETQVQEY
ncbi:MAG: hypothetical protein M3P82_04375, partial [Bacteroidota bacterium]|nr:hypothetical protein [Bacteroidota bacterium]